MMRLSEMKINEFLELLASKAPAPGGGSVSALFGAAGAALLSMVAELTVGKENFKEKEIVLKEIINESKRLLHILEEKVDEDTEAFNKVSEAYKMPKEKEEQKLERKKAIQEALKIAAEVPFSVIEACVDLIRLYERIVDNFNKNAASDIGVGILCLKAAILGAWLNVRINICSIEDPDFVRKYNEKGDLLLKEGIRLTEKIYDKVCGIIG
ncbi:cyclodeaminase/cyclohydrolase family protein [Thermovenabulum sp.]|uniref:cyclodeaminase/cyclohydrolase family protein n=1 Tax=Thermovenabulum sp. TaxID=3100335 RepID=UPI003C79F520